MNDTVMSKNVENPPLGTSSRRINFAAEIDRLVDEINFLRDRIEKIQSFKTPNPTMLNTYNVMLTEREKLLRQLQATVSPENELNGKITG